MYQMTVMEVDFSDFYVIRPLLCIQFCGSSSEFPPISLSELLEAFQTNDEQPVLVLKELLDRKKADNLKTGPRMAILDEWIDRLLSEGEKTAKSIPFIKEPPTQHFNPLVSDVILSASKT
eukprot:TRINITY_DN10359_c0_g1_i2.p2 TRINITY_DN10359_c0_g1~~TRINITY_DN10359_c0_g1_i2.p2  ORF type:complete len:120 (-),score=23.85 TRINITY_DN10359_c0_g1_i2:132-491(-)